ncbi:MAG: hypothetical protein O9972_22170 [Burkholderiales bacterium]|nr:hypothetical protein [Burkholderiales bacterium]
MIRLGVGTALLVAAGVMACFGGPRIADLYLAVVGLALVLTARD